MKDFYWSGNKEVTLDKKEDWLWHDLFSLGNGKVLSGSYLTIAD